MVKYGKISIIGSGRVGTNIAFSLILRNIGSEVLLVDINPEKLEAEALDLRDAKYFSNTTHVHKATFKDVRDSQIIILTAGEILRPEKSTKEVFEHNKTTFDRIFDELNPIDKEAILIVVTSPVDPLTKYALDKSGLPKNQVFGTGTFLDTERLRLKLSKKLGLNERSIHAYVLGEHGDTQFIPWSHATVAGRFLRDYFAESKEEQDKLLNDFAFKTRTKSDKILEKKKGTEFGIAACVSALCQDVIYDLRTVVPISTFVEEYGVCLSVLVALGGRGVTKILPLELHDMEKQQLQRSAQIIKGMLEGKFEMEEKREEKFTGEGKEMEERFKGEQWKREQPTAGEEQFKGGEEKGRMGEKIGERMEEKMGEKIHEGKPEERPYEQQQLPVSH
jgi:L-lactate dehydrogenase